MTRGLVSALVLLWSAQIGAEVTPSVGTGDPRVQTVAYDPNEVVALNFSQGFALTIQFSPDEQIETVILGDAGSWTTQTSRRADHLVIMPRGNPPMTNMTVLTDQRTYNFVLYGSQMGPAAQAFLVSFTYPTATAPGAPAALSQTKYRLRGDRDLWPLELSDDGTATTLRWSEDVTLPAVYSEKNGSGLALVNGVMRDGRYVLDAVYPKLVFIRGKARAQAFRQVSGQ